MKTSKFPFFPALLSALAVSGCFFGGGDGDGKSYSKVSPGFYVADYSTVPNPPDGPGTRGLETELTLTNDGNFRLFWIFDTSLFYDLRGRWKQESDGLHFTEMFDILRDRADSLTSVHDNDTNEVREVTATSFIRKEYTPLRQKPYWIKYNKQTPVDIKEGQYRFTVPGDSVTPELKATISFTGPDFKYTESDTIERFQFEAKWYQLGTVLGTVQNRRRIWVDSLNEFSAWDSLSGDIVQRVKVTDNSVNVWIPADPPFFSGGWTVYLKQ